MRYLDWDSEDYKDLNVTEKLQAVLASAAQLTIETEGGSLPQTAADVNAQGSPFVIPLLIPEQMESGDGRSMAKDALELRDLPLPLLWQPATGNGHENSYVVGRIDTIERLENGYGNARGVFDVGPYGREAERLVRAKMLRGVSADLDKFEATVNGEDVLELDPNKITSEKMEVTKARVMAATLLPKPAFQECSIMLEEDMPEDNIEITDGIYEGELPIAASAEHALSALIASVAPVNPPRDWFANPELSAATPLTLDDEGRVFGHIATWDTDHMGYNSGVRPPRSRSNYAYFRTGLVRTIEGEDVAVGQLTLVGGHAPLDADARSAVKHYDDTHSAVADVTAGEDQFGIWVSGALRPGVTPDQVRVFRASAPSGDWRPINGVLELVAVCQVNVPGFPIARAMMASGRVMALVAAGTATLTQLRNSETDALSSRVSQVERIVLQDKRAQLAARFAPIREERLARLREAAANARHSFEPELNARAELAARREELLARAAEFKMYVKPDFKEALHPRDDKGKFRMVLGRLTDLLKGDDNEDANAAKDSLQRAADLEDKGDQEGAKAAATEAKTSLDRATASADDTVKEDLKKVSDDIATAAAGKAEDVVKDTVKDTARGDAPAPASGEDKAPAEIGPDDLPEEIRDFIDLMIDELGENADPRTILSRMDNKMRHWLEGKGFDSPEELAKLIEKMMQRPIQPDIGQ